MSDGRAVGCRAEERGDHEAVRELHREAFGDHGRMVADLVDDLRESITADNGLSLVAEDGGRVIGQVMFTRGLLDAPRRLVEVQVLSPLAVLPARQREGVGAALIRHGLETMVERGVPLVFLEGDPRYYARFGFEPGGGHGFRRPSLRIPERAFQVIRLPTYEPWHTGTFVYSETFWRHDAVGLRDSTA
ncbi:N-acetyltransferase [Solwaraspora sp. WMMD1047]|uniref:GNAT family N-acetyltransferase n=1 Tax=Solwaraspora sp. WMMD1047 TaxID=3016102 RepID=UPI002415BDB7|nr:N-acetyltransferase [Solwaraspora sp. WMMD1047]MDG4828730.1 N-acetyltransferase [Solwaraspora sp. WMMD1047]